MGTRHIIMSARSGLTRCLFRPQAFSTQLAKGELRETKMAAMHPAVVWLIVAAVVGVTLLIATFFANRNRNKKKKGTFSIISSEALSLNSKN